MGESLSHAFQQLSTNQQFPNMSQFRCLTIQVLLAYAYSTLWILGTGKSHYWEGLGSTIVVGQYCENYSIDIEITLTMAPVYFMKFSLVTHKFFIVCLEPLVCVY